MSVGDNKVFLPRGAARSVSTIGSVSVDPVEHPAAQPLAQAPPQPPFHLPLLQHVEEPVAHDGVDVDFVAFRRAAAGLVFNECGG